MASEKTQGRRKPATTKQARAARPASPARAPAPPRAPAPASAPGVSARRVSHSAEPVLTFGRAWDYAPAPETMRVGIAPRYGNFINGAFADSARHMPTINPATEETLSEVPLSAEREVDSAVRAAREALPAWSALPGAERGKFLYRLARRVQERSRELAVLETLNGGKPIKESRDADLPLVAQHFFYHAGWADKLRWAFGGSSVKPVGVCAQIIPWNFPLLMAAWKIAPALACGNTVVLKPAETTPLTALRLGELCAEIGLPPGVVNIVTGDGSTGALLANHPGIDKIAFTGSTEVGRILAAIAAQRGIRLSLELGGKSPNIIFDDAPIDQAVEGIIRAIYFNQGHVCCAGSRLLVQESVLDRVIAKLKIRMKTLRVGDPLDKNTDVGAINSRAQLERIQSYIGGAEAEGAVVHSPCDFAPPERGFWCAPRFFTNVQQSHRLARDEVFGPVLAVMSFRTPEEAIQKANNTPYGLSAGIWTDKGSKVFEVARRLKAGVVWCNTFNAFDAASPFGGYRESGFAREGGVQGLRPYVQLG